MMNDRVDRPRRPVASFVTAAADRENRSMLAAFPSLRPLPCTGATLAAVVLSACATVAPPTPRPAAPAATPRLDVAAYQAMIVDARTLRAPRSAEVSPPEVKTRELTRALRGTAYVDVELGRLDDAEALYVRCLALDPNDAKAAGELRYVRAQQSKRISRPPAPSNPSSTSLQ